MDKRILGKDLEVSSIGLGCMGMSHAYGTVSTEKEAEEAIDEMLDNIPMSQVFGGSKIQKK